MYATENQGICMSIDLKQNRIRIFKSLFRFLGEPQYIQLLVNPQKREVAIRTVDRPLASDMLHRVNPSLFTTDKSYEISSRAFVNQLRAIMGNLQGGYTYRMEGRKVPSQNMILFSMNTLHRIEK